MDTIVIPTQARPEISGVTPPQNLKSQTSHVKFQTNEGGKYWVQFPNLEPEWCELQLEKFVPTYEFEDCVFGDYLGSILKIFKAEFTYPYSNSLQPIGGGWL